MSYTLKIRFTGLCAFTQNNDGSRLSVLLTEGRTAANSTGDHASPVILFNRADLDPSNTRHPDMIFPGETSAKDSICFLDREDIAFLPRIGSIEGPDLEFDASGSSDTEADESNRHRWDWIPSLSDINPDNDRVAEGCFTNPPTSPVAARLEFGAGRFFTEELLRREEDSVGDNSPTQQVNFQNLDDEVVLPDRSTAILASCELHLSEGSAISIKTSPWGSGESRPLDFVPRSNDLEIEIWNVPFSDIMSAWNLDEFPGPDGFGDSFSHHYRLLPTPPAVELLPRRGASSSNRSVIRIRDKDDGCIPVRPSPQDFESLSLITKKG